MTKALFHLGPQMSPVTSKTPVGAEPGSYSSVTFVSLRLLPTLSVSFNFCAFLQVGVWASLSTVFVYEFSANFYLVIIPGLMEEGVSMTELAGDRLLCFAGTLKTFPLRPLMHSYFHLLVSSLPSLLWCSFWPCFNGLLFKKCPLLIKPTTSHALIGHSGLR